MWLSRSWCLLFWQVLLEVGGPGLDGRQANGGMQWFTFNSCGNPEKFSPGGSKKRL